MSAKNIKNLSASVLARLLNLAEQTGDNYQVLLAKFVSERFLYRLGRSDLRERFVLKGAMLLWIWSDHPYRATRDLDLLRRGEGGAEGIRGDVEAICATKVDADGIEFDGKSIRLEAIRPEDEYAGTRVTLLARCGSARIPMQVDIGVADALWPPAQSRIFPILLDFPPPEVLTYAPESVIAEKLEAIVVLGDRNSRIKDYFDLRYLANRFEFDGTILTESIRRTFQRRRTAIPKEDPFGLTAEYWDNPARITQIRAFTRRANLEVGPDAGKEILGILRPFLLPILENLREGVKTPGIWPPGGPWR
jgi:predicted nucleotidyltransferase component of viral defense system